MISFELFEVGEGHGYRIIKNDIVIQVQEFNPDADGFVPMTEEEATTIAGQIVQALNEFVEEAPEEVKTPEQIKIEQLETENAQMKLELADVQLALAELFTI